MKALFAILFFAVTAEATTFHVSTTGNDSTGTGTSGNPWRSWQKCSNSATNGDVCTMSAGTYTESVVANAGITFNVNPGDTVSLDGGANNNTFICAGDGVTLDGSAGTLKILNGGNFNGSQGAIQCTGHNNFTIKSIIQSGSAAYGVNIGNLSGLTITNSEFTADGSTGINVAAGSSNITVKNNHIHHVSGFFLVAFFADIENSIGSCNNSTPPISCTTYMDFNAAAPSGAITNVVFNNNEVNDSVPYMGLQEGVQVNFVWGGDFENNFIHDVYDTGIQVELGNRRIILKNNIFDNIANGGTSTASETGPWSAVCVFCLVEGNITRNAISHCFNIDQSHHNIVRFNICHDLKGYLGYGSFIEPATNVNVGAVPGATFNRIVFNTWWNINTYPPPNTDYGFIGTNDEAGVNSFGIYPCNSCVNSNVVKNNIFSEAKSANDVKKLESDDFTGDYNIWWNSTRALSLCSGMGIASTVSCYTFANYKTTFSQETHSINSDPLFSDPTNGNYALKSGSPAIDAGQFLTTISSSTGSGSTIVVADANYFMDGYGQITGDTIKTSAGQTAIITSVNYTTNTLVLDRSISWTNGDGVSYPYNGTAPDMGALESSNPQPSNNFNAQDNFDTYTVGANLTSLNGGSNWTTAWVDSSPAAPQPMTIASVAGFSGNAVSADGAADRAAYRTFNAFNQGTGYVQMAAATASGMTGRCEFGFYAAGTSRLGGIIFLNGNIQLENTSPGTYTTLQSYTANSVYTLNWQFDAIAQPNKYRVAINGGSFSSWTTMPNTYSTIDTVSLRNAASGTTCYFDSIGPNAPTGGSAPTLSSISAVNGFQGTTTGETLAGTAFNGGGATINVSGAGITVSNTVVVTATTMTANFTIAANATLGAHNVSVTTTNGTSGNVTFTVNPVWSFTVQPSNTLNGHTMSPSVVATNSDNTFASTATLTISGCGASASGNTATASGGVATFASLGMTGTGTGCTFTVTGGSAQSAVSHTFNVSNATFVVNVQPSTTVTGNTMVPSVLITDSDNTFGGTVTLTMNSCGASASNNTATASAGVATFGSMNMTGLGAGCSFTISASGATNNVTNTFNVINAPPKTAGRRRIRK
jgi:hypothetical protein